MMLMRNPCLLMDTFNLIQKQPRMTPVGTSHLVKNVCNGCDVPSLLTDERLVVIFISIRFALTHRCCSVWLPLLDIIIYLVFRLTDWEGSP